MDRAITQQAVMAVTNAVRRIERTRGPEQAERTRDVLASLSAELGAAAQDWNYPPPASGKGDPVPDMAASCAWLSGVLRAGAEARNEPIGERAAPTNPTSTRTLHFPLEAAES